MKLLTAIWILLICLGATYNTQNSKLLLLANAKKYVEQKNHESASIAIHEYMTMYGVDAEIKTLQKKWVPLLIKAYLEPSLIKARPVRWKVKPSKTNCTAGILDTFEYLSFESNLNLIRLLAGVPKVNDIDIEFSLACQQAAWVMHVNEDIDHKIPKNWKCYSVSADLAASSSNLSYGYSAGQALVGMMRDEEDNNSAAGHRRWLLNPALTFPGYGLTDNTTAIWVIGQKANFREVYNDLSYYDTHPITWPVAGSHPIMLVSSRFSITIRKADFSNAKVSVTKNGKSVAIKKYTPTGNYGNPTLVFDVPTIPKVGETYAISVSNIKDANGNVVRYNYETSFME